MDASRDVDVVNIHKEQAIITYTTRPHYDSSSWSSTTLQYASSSRSASKMNMELTVNPALYRDFGPRDDQKVFEASPISEPRPEITKLAWIRYSVINIYRRLFSLVFVGNLAAFV